jgi:hypothetical protein
LSTIPETIPTYNTVDEAPADVGDCWIGGVLYHRCGSGRKQNRQNAVAPCGELKPHTTPHYWRNGVYQANAAGGHYDITCGECKTRGRLTSVKRTEHVTETPHDRAVVVLAPEHAKQFYDPERGLYNLTAMWRASGGDANRDPAAWLRLDETGAFLAELNMVQNHILSQRGRNGGTWAHWQIAVAYAKYLSPAFHIQWNEYAAAYLRGEQHTPPHDTTPSPVHVEYHTPPPPPINEYARLLEHVTQTGESAITMRNHLTLTEQWVDSLPSVVEALENYLTGLRPLADAVQKRRNPLRHGWIYVLHDPVGRRYKIGMTQDPDPKKRKAGVEGQWGKGQSVQVVWIETDNIQLERVIHAHYKRRGVHLRDEWYRLSPDDIDRIRALGSFVRFRDFVPESLDVIAVVQNGLFGDAS